MGQETGDRQQTDAFPSPAPRSALPPSGPKTADRDTTYGCISFARTGSAALADAIAAAGFPDAHHLHFLGPRAIELGRLRRDPALALAMQVAARVDDAGHRFRLATSVRDPIARLLSQAFHIHARTGADIVRDRDAVIYWWESQAVGRFDLWPVWFDDTFKSTFGFDFREHPFDHERRSTRFVSDKLRLLVLRQEDEPGRRERELGWLLDRDDVKLRTINDTPSLDNGPAYRSLVENFAAPSSWLDAFYDGGVIRHYYTQAERDGFRQRWRKSKTHAVGLPDARGPEPCPPSLPEPRTRRIACVSIMKTSSTALVCALRDAGFADAAHVHFLGPRACALDIAGAPGKALAAQVECPQNKFSIATCVRDPIARWLSQAFHDEIKELARTGRSIVESFDTFVAWVEATATPDHLQDWFDDSLKATFGFDYRNHPFDFERRSLRFSSDRLRLVILRQEDPVAGKETELGWLVGRDRVAIATRNDSLVRYEDRYRSFRDTFVAPASWLDTFYETEIVRHFFTDAERDAFRARWSGRRVPRSRVSL